MKFDFSGKGKGNGKNPFLKPKPEPIAEPPEMAEVPDVQVTVSAEPPESAGEEPVAEILEPGSAEAQRVKEAFAQASTGSDDVVLEAEAEVASQAPVEAKAAAQAPTATEPPVEHVEPAPRKTTLDLDSIKSKLNSDNPAEHLEAVRILRRDATNPGEVCLDDDNKLYGTKGWQTLKAGVFGLKSPTRVGDFGRYVSKSDEHRKTLLQALGIGEEVETVDDLYVVREARMERDRFVAVYLLAGDEIREGGRRKAKKIEARLRQAGLDNEQIVDTSRANARNPVYARFALKIVERICLEDVDQLRRIESLYALDAEGLEPLVMLSAAENRGKFYRQEQDTNDVRRVRFDIAKVANKRYAKCSRDFRTTVLEVAYERRFNGQVEGDISAKGTKEVKSVVEIVGESPDQERQDYLAWYLGEFRRLRNMGVTQHSVDEIIVEMVDHPLHTSINVESEVPNEDQRNNATKRLELLGLVRGKRTDEVPLRAVVLNVDESDLDSELEAAGDDAQAVVDKYGNRTANLVVSEIAKRGHRRSALYSHAISAIAHEYEVDELDARVDMTFAYYELAQTDVDALQRINHLLNGRPVGLAEASYCRVYAESYTALRYAGFDEEQANGIFTRILGSESIQMPELADGQHEAPAGVQARMSPLLLGMLLQRGRESSAELLTLPTRCRIVGVLVGTGIYEVDDAVAIATNIPADQVASVHRGILSRIKSGVEQGQVLAVRELVGEYVVQEADAEQELELEREPEGHVTPDGLEDEDEDQLVELYDLDDDDEELVELDDREPPRDEDDEDLELEDLDVDDENLEEEVDRPEKTPPLGTPVIKLQREEEDDQPVELDEVYEEPPPRIERPASGITVSSIVAAAAAVLLAVGIVVYPRDQKPVETQQPVEQVIPKEEKPLDIGPKTTDTPAIPVIKPVNVDGTPKEEVGDKVDPPKPEVKVEPAGEAQGVEVRDVAKEKPVEPPKVDDQAKRAEQEREDARKAAEAARQRAERAKLEAQRKAEEAAKKKEAEKPKKKVKVPKVKKKKKVKPKKDKVKDAVDDFWGLDMKAKTRAVVAKLRVKPKIRFKRMRRKV